MSVLFGIVIFPINWDKRTSVVLGLVVFSHWILDFIVQIPDSTLLLRESPNLGLGLWSSGPGFIVSIILEFILFAGGLAFYLTWRKLDKGIISQDRK